MNEPPFFKNIDYEFIISGIQSNFPEYIQIILKICSVIKEDQFDKPILKKEDSSTFGNRKNHHFRALQLQIPANNFYPIKREPLHGNKGSFDLGAIRELFYKFFNFKKYQLKNEEFHKDLVDLWIHSLGVASVSRSLGGFLNRKDLEIVYSSGLLHDIGKVVRLRLDILEGTGQVAKDKKIAKEKSLNFFKAELFNQSPRHDYIGYLMFKRVGLSTVLAKVVKWHHEFNPELRHKENSKEENELIDIVILANWIVSVAGFGFSGHENADTPPVKLFERLNLNEEEKIKSFLNKTFKQLEDVTLYFDVVGFRHYNCLKNWNFDQMKNKISEKFFP